MAEKRSIFLIYNHAEDQGYCDEFSRVFSDIYTIVCTGSHLGAGVNENPDKTLLIARDCIAGACCAVVLCGAKTPGDSNVDCVIGAAVEAGLGLIGINLPGSLDDPHGRVLIPEKLHEYIASGCAMWLEWVKLIEAPLMMGAYIEIASSKMRRCSKKP